MSIEILLNACFIYIEAHMVTLSGADHMTLIKTYKNTHKYVAVWIYENASKLIDGIAYIAILYKHKCMFLIMTCLTISSKASFME